MPPIATGFAKNLALRRFYCHAAGGVFYFARAKRGGILAFDPLAGERIKGKEQPGLRSQPGLEFLEIGAGEGNKVVA
jgi:hypothetical protein